ncbi:MAG: heat-inducible transcriptional repressor HrcA [Lachnospiraceae bacterium]|nr:heat-inducible transcriptional repressor HrcA [Lachnospiraceae bacterium]
MDELSERQVKILNVIIRTYMKTGEPVGSRTISKESDLNLSSATIRNEMSDLEEMGYILQPHTSAGRIPSDKGYRFYVDRLMLEKENDVSEMKDFVIEKTEKMEQVLKTIAKLLAANTNYATVVSAPQTHRGKVKFIQLSTVDQDQVLATIMLDGNVVKNKIIRTAEELDQETMLKLNILLNGSLNGLTLEEINLVTIARLKEQAGIHSEVVGSVLDAVAEAVQEDEDLEIYTSGATNIFRYPELSDSERARDLISAFEEKQELRDLFSGEDGEPGTGIQVYIGDESPIRRMKDCSVVTATYELGEGIHGTVGIVGPKRMDYQMVVDNLKTLKVQLDEIFNKKEEKT